MKVYVSQGHENGIGLEVFFKTCLLLPKEDLNLIQLVAFKSPVEKTLSSLKHPFLLTDSFVCLSGVSIPVIWLDKIKYSQTFSALNAAMDLASRDGILYTLPSSKDQFPSFPGHTEYFRKFYKNDNLGMFFSSSNLQVLLLSDHVPISQLSKILSENLIYSRLKLSLDSLSKWGWPVENVFVSGLNPHGGEHGLIGNEDIRISKVIKRLTSETKFKMSGPWPGDTMIFEKKKPYDLLVYPFHDQGLGVFKSIQGFIGSNITLGLPYLRFSPDHGTAFGLYGKNSADYRGCSFSLKQALKTLTRISYGQNSSY